MTAEEGGGGWRRRRRRSEEDGGGEHEGAEECADPPTVCNEREVVDDWPRIDSQFCQTSHAMPTKTVRVDMVKMLWLRRGVKVGRG